MKKFTIGEILLNTKIILATIESKIRFTSILFASRSRL